MIKNQLRAQCLRRRRPVAVSGERHIVVTQTVDGNGGVHLDFHQNSAGIEGVGLSTGARYTFLVTQHTTELNLEGGQPPVLAFTLEQRLIGEGPDHNAVLIEVGHLTINPNGEITAESTAPTFCPLTPRGDPAPLAWLLPNPTAVQLHAYYTGSAEW